MDKHMADWLERKTDRLIEDDFERNDRILELGCESILDRILALDRDRSEAHRTNDELMQRLAATEEENRRLYERNVDFQRQNQELKRLLAMRSIAQPEVDTTMANVGLLMDTVDVDGDHCRKPEREQSPCMSAQPEMDGGTILGQNTRAPSMPGPPMDANNDVEPTLTPPTGNETHTGGDTPRHVVAKRNNATTVGGDTIRKKFHCSICGEGKSLCLSLALDHFWGSEFRGKKYTAR